MRVRLALGPALARWLQIYPTAPRCEYVHTQDRLLCQPPVPADHTIRAATAAIRWVFREAGWRRARAEMHADVETLGQEEQPHRIKKEASASASVAPTALAPARHLLQVGSVRARAAATPITSSRASKCFFLPLCTVLRRQRPRRRQRISIPSFRMKWSRTSWSVW